MAIQFNKVTWYSKALAFIIFFASIALAFYLGMQYGTLKALIRFSPEPIPTPAFTPMPSASPAASQAVRSLPEEQERDVTLSVGQATSAEGLTVTLNKIEQDSRCPSDVQCIQAGNVITNVTLVSSARSENRNMASNEAPYRFATYDVSIQSVHPQPVSTRNIQQNEYRVTFRIVAF